MRPVSEIIIHCTDTRPDWWDTMPAKAKTAEVRRWHVEERKWSDIGYHYTIDRDGSLTPGRPLERAGAHCRGHNKNSIGIALFGGYGSSENDNFLDNFTPQQMSSLQQLVEHLKDTFGTIKKVSGHNDYDTKACPGFKVSRYFT
jgi:N-acetylmuramoyl-L-alanine amidase